MSVNTSFASGGEIVTYDIEPGELLLLDSRWSC